jgi:hypothetical protein
MRCPRCGYDWKPRVPNPRECPRCKIRLDYPPKVLRAPRPPASPEMKRMEVRKGMAQRLPWVAAAIVIIVVAALGAWVLTVPPAVPPAPAVPATESWTASVWGTTTAPSLEAWGAGFWVGGGALSAESWGALMVAPST